MYYHTVSHLILSKMVSKFVKAFKVSVLHSGLALEYLPCSKESKQILEICSFGKETQATLMIKSQANLNLVPKSLLLP